MELFSLFPQPHHQENRQKCRAIRNEKTASKTQEVERWQKY